jgi:hypothetical protein
MPPSSLGKHLSVVDWAGVIVWVLCKARPAGGVRYAATQLCLGPITDPGWQLIRLVMIYIDISTEWVGCSKGCEECNPLC